MNYNETIIPEVKIFQTEPRTDERGSFSRIFCVRELLDAGIHFSVAQINQSLSTTSGTIRGLHMQREPFAEDKLISCLAGAIFDVAVDMRPWTETYLQYVSVELTPENGLMLYVPRGFAHGFQTLESNTKVQYAVSAPYTPASEVGFRWDDPVFSIQWPASADVITSPKDADWPLIT